MLSDIKKALKNKPLTVTSIRGEKSEDPDVYNDDEFYWKYDIDLIDAKGELVDTGEPIISIHKMDKFEDEYLVWSPVDWFPELEDYDFDGEQAIMDKKEVIDFLKKIKLPQEAFEEITEFEKEMYDEYKELSDPWCS